MPWAVLGPSSHLPTDSTLSPIPNKHPQMCTPDGHSDCRRPQVTRSRLLFHIRGFEVTHAAFRRQPLALKPTPQPTACHPGRSRPPSFFLYYFYCIHHFPKCYRIYSFITPIPISFFGARNAHQAAQRYVPRTVSVS